MNKLSLIVAFGLLVTILHAGTVTFTGTCTQFTAAPNILGFGLLNSGNDTAYNLQVVPVVHGTAATPYQIKSIGPSQQTAQNITLQNITADGSYADYVNVAYQQSGSEFSVVFPCLLHFQQTAPSSVSLTYAISYPNGAYEVNVSVSNNGNSDVQDNVSLIFPPGFTYSPSDSINVTLKSAGSGSISFMLHNPADGAYSGAIASSYVFNGVHYSTVTPISLVPTAAVPKSALLLVFYGLSIGLVVVLLLLITRAYLIRKRQDKA